MQGEYQKLIVDRKQSLNSVAAQTILQDFAANPFFLIEGETLEVRESIKQAKDYNDDTDDEVLNFSRG